MKKLEMNQMEMIEGGKFWGTGQKEFCTTNPMGGEFCQTCNVDYMFWIPVSDAYSCGPVYQK
jgi:hypothetical protein